jgi:hypothetical protein
VAVVEKLHIHSSSPAPPVHPLHRRGESATRTSSSFDAELIWKSGHPHSCESHPRATSYRQLTSTGHQTPILRVMCRIFLSPQDTMYVRPALIGRPHSNPQRPECDRKDGASRNAATNVNPSRRCGRLKTQVRILSGCRRTYLMIRPVDAVPDESERSDMEYME